MKKILLVLALCISTVASYAQWEPFESIQPQRPQLIEPTQSQMKRVLGTNNPAYLPHKGEPHILTILVNYADSAISVNNPKVAFDQFFNAEGNLKDLGNGNFMNHGSVRKYFSDMSNGKFRPHFDVYGPVTLLDSMKVYGGTANNGSDEKPYKLIADALKLLSDSISNDSIFDSNNDGYIDCIYVIYAGPGQNYGGGVNTVWAKTGQVSGNFKNLKLGWYSMAGELSPTKVGNWKQTGQSGNQNNLITGIGVTCHELSHAMGLPDIYPTVSIAHVDNQEMEYWDLMDGGEYTRKGYCPTAYTAWEKNLMDWDVNIKKLSTSENITMDKTTEENGKVYKLVNAAKNEEYFLMENIQKTQWNSYLPGHGLLVYHVNEVDNSSIYTFTHLNNTKGRPGMAVVPADGACLSSYIDANKSNYVKSHAGDPFPGTSNVTALNDTLGLPNFCWYYGTNDTTATVNADGKRYLKVNAALKDITEQNGTVSFSFISDFATGIREVTTEPRKISTGIYSLTGEYLGKNIYALPKGVYIRNGKKFIKR